MALATACLASAYGCSSAPPIAEDEPLATTKEALTGTVAFDGSCSANAMRHFQISEAYTRIIASSPAFRECLQNVMTRPTTLGLPGDVTWVSGPYYPCDGDPATTLAGVMSHVQSTNGTRITCDPTTAGGSSYVGNIDSAGREIVSVGTADGALSTAENCNYNPDGAACAGDGTYIQAAETIAHEGMHTHGYHHVADAVNNLNNVNVGDLVGAPPVTPLTLADFCGVMPAFTPGNGGVAPHDPTSTPSPGRHPTYGNGIPYEVGQCVTTVLRWSLASGHLHDDCGPSFAGLRVVDSVMSGSPTSNASHCVADPYVGASYPSNVGGAPIPPHAPTGCTVNACEGPAVLHCTDANANVVRLEQRASGSSAPWVRASDYSVGLEYRACAESLYGRACSVPTILTTDQGAICPPPPPPIYYRPDDIPWFQWEPFTGTPNDGSSIATLLGGTIMALPVPVDAVGFSGLGKASGDLSPAFGALGVGVFNAQIGDFSDIGPSTGALPPVRGTAFAAAIGNDGLPHLLGIGGETSQGAPIGNLYDGALTRGKSTSTSWVSTPMPDARAHAAAASDSYGTTVFVVGGRTTTGVSGDLSSYAMAKGTWTTIAAQAMAPRTDAAMAIDGSSVVVFGGRDANGKTLGDLVVRDLVTGKTQTFMTSLTPRANAAIAVRQGQVFVYGGLTSGGASEMLDVVSLADGKTISSSKVGLAAASGSSIGLGANGVLTLVPGAVPGSKVNGGAFLGPLGQLTFVAE